MRRKWVIALSVVSLCGSAVGFLNCSTTDNGTVAVAACDASKLDLKTTEDSTVKAYSDTGAQFLTASQALEKKFMDVCNAMDADLGLAPGADVRAACNPVAKKIADALKEAPAPGPGVPPAIWVATIFDPSCAPDPTAEAKCIDSCSGKPACDVAKACPEGKLVGSCSGTCGASCVEVSPTPAACVGACFGDVPLQPSDAGPVPPCNGDCVGTCKAKKWTARCEAGCSAGFVGDCRGLCTGKCDGVLTGPVPVDAGIPPPVDAGDDSGDAAPPVDAGAPDSGPPAPGINCPGVCAGVCSAQASGACAAPCTGAFSAGTCGACTGTCAGGPQPSVDFTSCTGKCNYSSGAGTCAGSCTGKCSVPMTGVACKASLNCDANTECKRTCALAGALAAKCGAPFSAGVNVAGNYDLYAPLKKHMPDFIAALNQLETLRASVEGITDRTSGNFAAVGVRRDVSFACVEAANAVYKQAFISFQNASNAGQAIKGKSF
jgi:hypothetical protein